MPHAKILLSLLLAARLPAPSPGCGRSRCTAIAMHGAPKHPPGFAHFPYVNPDAPKGGRLVLGTLGTFDSLNPFIIKGVTPGDLREYVYESLMTRSGDEPFTLYGLIAESVEVPEDRSSITFHLRAEARFSDGAPITPEDVLFSHEVLKEKGWPYHRSHYAKVAQARRRSVRAACASPSRPPATARSPDPGLMPILPRHKLDAETFERTTLEPPLGSGPYTVARVDAGRSITYRRNPDWWARDLPVTRGRFNFDEIRVEYFRDAASLFEAFKAGEIDMRPEDDPGRWIEGYNFPAVADGRVIKREFDTGLPSGMSALVFNTRRPMFADAARAPRLHPAVRRRVDQPQPVQRRLPAHAELLRALRAVLARPAGRRARARAAGPLRTVREAGGAGRHLHAARAPTAAAITAPTCRPPTSF